MKKKNRWKTLSTAGLLSALILAGCGNSEETTKEASGESGEKSYQVGITQIAEHPSLDAASVGFQQALKDEGLEVEFDTQVAQGDQNNNQSIANNFVSDQVDLIFANSTPSALGALNATKDIPIVFTSVTDAVGGGLVDSMEAPGGNITGTLDNHPDAIPNTVEFIDKYFDIDTIGVVYNSGEANSVSQIETVKEVIEGTGLKLAEATVSTSAEVKQATESLVGKADVLYIITDNTVVTALESVVQVATDKKIPLFVGELDSVARGGFAAYGFDYNDIGYEAGVMAAEILKGEKEAGEMDVQYPQNLKLVINKEAAEAMGVELNPEWEESAEFIE